MEKLIIKSEIKNISLVEKLVDDVSVNFNLSSDLYGKVLLAVVEAANNSIVHGNKMDETKNVTIEYQISDKYLEFLIKDEGSGFDYTSIPDPTLPENLEKTHGRGLFLIENLADEVKYENEGSSIRLFFNL